MKVKEHDERIYKQNHRNRRSLSDARKVDADTGGVKWN